LLYNPTKLAAGVKHAFFFPFLSDFPGSLASINGQELHKSYINTGGLQGIA